MWTSGQVTQIKRIVCSDRSRKDGNWYSGDFCPNWGCKLMSECHVWTCALFLFDDVLCNIELFVKNYRNVWVGEEKSGQSEHRYTCTVGEEVRHPSRIREVHESNLDKALITLIEVLMVCQSLRANSDCAWSQHVLAWSPAHFTAKILCSLFFSFTRICTFCHNYTTIPINGRYFDDHKIFCRIISNTVQNTFLIVLFSYWILCSLPRSCLNNTQNNGKTKQRLILSWLIAL